MLFLCVCWVFLGGGETKKNKKTLKAAFMVWMDYRCIDRVVIMEREGMGGCLMGSVCISFMGEEDRLW